MKFFQSIFNAIEEFGSAVFETIANGFEAIGEFFSNLI